MWATYKKNKFTFEENNDQALSTIKQKQKKNSAKQSLVGDNNSCRLYRTTSKRVGCKFKFSVKLCADNHWYLLFLNDYECMYHTNHKKLKLRDLPVNNSSFLDSEKELMKDCNDLGLGPTISSALLSMHRQQLVETHQVRTLLDKEFINTSLRNHSPADKLVDYLEKHPSVSFVLLSHELTNDGSCGYISYSNRGRKKLKQSEGKLFIYFLSQHG